MRDADEVPDLVREDRLEIVFDLRLVIADGDGVVRGVDLDVRVVDLARLIVVRDAGICFIFVDDLGLPLRPSYQRNDIA